MPRGQQWRMHPASGVCFPLSHWWRLNLLPAGADIKDVWEPGRFAWAYDLIRAYTLSGDPRYARAFHRYLADWEQANPAFQGPHWACGQETAIRALALLHAEVAFGPDSSSAEAARLAAVLASSAERIANAIGYGLSQRNNHGISEAAGLVHLGLRLRGEHPRASAWVGSGTRLLNEQIRDQFAPDGWYSQHSFNYMRVALDQALAAQRALQGAGLTLSQDALQRVDAAIALLTWLVDSASGELPNHGANDGARVLALSSADYRDFRPLLTLAAVVRELPLPADIPADAEVLCCLNARRAPTAPARSAGIRSGSSGWAAGRVGRCAFFFRAGKYAHRPSHLDALHLDLRIDGREVITDAGTYAYNGLAPWKNGLAGAEVHNGPVIVGEAVATRGSRFLWLSWPRARLVTVESTAAGAGRLLAERPGRVRREVLFEQSRICVRDTALTAGSRLQVTWLLHPDVAGNPIEAEGAQVIEAREGDVRGWYSPTYGQRRRSRAVHISRSSEEGGGTIETSIQLQLQVRSGDGEAVL